MRDSGTLAIERFQFRLRRAGGKLLRARSLADALQGWRMEEQGGYSLGQFLRTRSLFLHIPKTGGISVARALYGNLAGGHRSFADYQLAFSPRELDRFFTFAFVRNPWDRALSAYSFLKAGGMNDKDRRWSDTHLARVASFEQFVLEGLEPAAQSQVHFRPQTSFLAAFDGNVRLPDFIGRFETLEADFAAVAARVNPAASLPHLNRAADKPDFRRSYTPEMTNTIARIYRSDIERFGYSFDSAGTDDQNL